MPHRKLVAKLKATAAVTALVPAARIRPVRQAQSASLPCITYQVTSLVTEDGIDGTSNTQIAEITLTCWAATYDDAWDVAGVVHTALHYWRDGNDGGEVMQCRCDVQADAPELVEESAEMAIHAVTQNYTIEYRKA